MAEKVGVFKEYFREIKDRYLKGDYTESTMRTPFENFIKSLDKKFNMIHEPRRIPKLGAPDFRAYRNEIKIGYIETKDLGKNLDEELKTEQIDKYKQSINNIILTNYGRFILIRKSEKVLDFSLFNFADLANPNYVISQEKIQDFQKLVETFFDYNLPTITSPLELSIELSKKAKLLKDLAKIQLEEDLVKIGNNQFPSSVYGFYEGMKELIKDINFDSCADAYAQTITYGLFLAKMNAFRHGEIEISRENAASQISQSIGLIKKIFLNISSDSSLLNLSWIIDEIIDILNASDFSQILSQMDSRGKTDKDPFTFFYEDFLAEYDPQKKKHMGVFYTPRPVINYIANSIHILLKENFNKPRGFADDSVTILDPALGTGTFLWLTYLITLKEIKECGLGGVMMDKVRNHILKHFYGFEILVIPYIIAHLKLTLLLSDWHYNLLADERIPVYLTNTLEPTESHGLTAFMTELNEESKTANQIKQERKILVILGNPPYHGLSMNKGKWIDDLLKKGYKLANGTRDLGYYKIDGKPLGEKNPKWLQDDYVKFIRFTQWKIDISGEGIVGLITNHAYLDNPTFKGMRQSLLNSFNTIFILNLHGNSQKKEKCPDGSKDENVFDIKQGVSISLFIKNSKIKDRKIFYSDVYGKRNEKYIWLDRNVFSSVEWQELKPESPNYLFYSYKFVLTK